MRKKFKKGAASFYIVAFSTLILVVIATSFAMVIMSEIIRTSNDDLSQSAYDSALAGVEDAKVAFSNYRRCAEAGIIAPNSWEETNDGDKTQTTCKKIMWWMAHPDCYMVGHILGKILPDEETEVVVGGETVTGSKDTTTNQAYTCVMITTDLFDYRTTLGAKKKVQTMRASAENYNASAVKKIKISWFSVRNDVQTHYTNFDNNTGMVVFPFFQSSSMAVPPTVELQIVQTAQEFKLSDFDLTENGNRTNRGTLYLVPTSKYSYVKHDENYDEKNYIGVYHVGSPDKPENGINEITAEQVTKTNDRRVKNKPFAVYCNPNSQADFYCSVEVVVPEPIGGGERNNDTFMISVSLPYQQPDTDFSIELCSDSGCRNADTTSGESSNEPIKIANAQISIDSTGRANDLYRRVETRLETADTTFKAGYPYYALQVLGDNGVKKEMTVPYERDCTAPTGCFYF